MRTVRHVVDRALVLYLVFGILNYIFCTALMFFLFNVFGVNEHIAPVINYGLGGVIQYLSCKYWIFPGAHKGGGQWLRFIIETVVCYGISYYLFAPLCADFLLRQEAVYDFFTFGGGPKITANCEMAVGSLGYALLNYFGQRYFVFSKRFT